LRLRAHLWQTTTSGALRLVYVFGLHGPAR